MGRIARVLKKITEIDPAPTTLRTTEMKHEDYLPFNKGCPQCGELIVVTKTRIFRIEDNVEIRFCRCRVCGWEGGLKR